MGSSNSTNIQNYVNNNTDIRSAINANFSASGSSKNVTFGNQTTSVTVGDASQCCAGLTGTDLSACISNTGNTTMKCGSGISINQTGIYNMVVTQTVTASTNASLVTAIQAATTAQIQNLVNQNNDASLISAFTNAKNSSDVVSICTTSLNKDLEVGISQAMQSSIQNSSGQTSSLNFLFCSGLIESDQCTFGQTFSISLYTTNVLGAVANITSKNSLIQTLAAHVKNTSGQTNTNVLSDLIKALGKFEQVIVIAIIGVVILGAIFLLFEMVRSFKGHKGEHTGVDYSRGNGHSDYNDPHTLNYNSKGLDPYGDGFSSTRGLGAEGPVGNYYRGSQSSGLNFDDIPSVY